jgi:nitrogen regulatory protein PII
MKKVEVIVKPFKLDEVKEALAREGIEGMTVSDVIGSDKGHLEIYRDTEHVVGFRSEIKIELLLDDHKAARALEVFDAMARARRIAYGTIAVSPVDTIIRLHCGDRRLSNGSQ